VAVRDVNVSNSMSESNHPSAQFKTKLCSDYTLEALTDLYNQTRIDYIVPMPMNSRRFSEYIQDYDVQTDESVVITDEHESPVGIGMLAFRDRRAWITRLGVHPDYRMKGVGRLIMQALLYRARANGAAQVQLEVITGNEPAIRLFQRCAFRPMRELLVLTRPPAKLEHEPPADITVESLTAGQIEQALRDRKHSTPSWIDEAPSLLKSKDIVGFIAHHSSGTQGWVVFRKSRFQLSHFVLEVEPDCPYEITVALLDTLHRSFPSLDTKYENLDAYSPSLPALQAMGYIEIFRRLEMMIAL
jgi:ribosomal protein S18 acetylase RimI-like enzyme